jgi:hypothetical protein
MFRSARWVVIDLKVGVQFAEDFGAHCFQVEALPLRGGMKSESPDVMVCRVQKSNSLLWKIFNEPLHARDIMTDRQS